MKSLDEALDKVTIPMLKGISNGEHIKLNNSFTLCMQSEGEALTIYETKEGEWNEVSAVLFNEEADEIVFDFLNEDYF